MKRNNLAFVLITLVIPTAVGADHKLAGVEIRNLNLDRVNEKMSFDLANTTDKWITAWAWRIEQPNSPDGLGVRWCDNYLDFDIPGLTSAPPESVRRIRPGEVRHVTDPLQDDVSDVQLVAVVFEDTTAYGEPSVLDRLEKQRRMDIDTQQTLLSIIEQIRASLNLQEAVQRAIAQIVPPPQNKSHKDLLVRSNLEQIEAQLKLSQWPAQVIAFHESVAKAQLERARAQARFKRMQ